MHPNTAQSAPRTYGVTRKLLHLPSARGSIAAKAWCFLRAPAVLEAEATMHNSSCSCTQDSAMDGDRKLGRLPNSCLRTCHGTKLHQTRENPNRQKLRLPE